MIETGETYFPKVDGAKARVRSLLSQKLISSNKVRVKINHGRLIVCCPCCNNAEFFWEDKLFFCSECKNAMIDGKLYEVIIPKERKQIGGLLEKRPLWNRNWEYPETVDDLIKENEMHGIGV